MNEKDKKKYLLANAIGKHNDNIEEMKEKLRVAKSSKEKEILEIKIDIEKCEAHIKKLKFKLLDMN